MLKDTYDILVLSSYLNSKLTACYLSQKNNNIILLDINKKNIQYDDNYAIYPYQAPFISLNSKFYLNDYFSYIGLKKINNYISKPSFLSVVFGNKKICFHQDYIKNDIEAEFKDCSTQILEFLDYIRIINEKINPLFLNEIKYPPTKITDYYYFFKNADSSIIKYFKQDIDNIYKKFKLPDAVVRFFNVILFFLSSVRRDKYLAVPAIRLLSESLNGLCSYIGEEHIEDTVNKNLKTYFDIIEDVKILDFFRKKRIYNVRLNNYIGNLKTKYVIKDSIEGNFKGLDINTLNVFVGIDYLPSFLGEYTLYVDCDKSYWYNLNDIYVVRILRKEDYGVVCISSFNQKNKVIEKFIYNKMYNVLLKMFPFIDKGNFKIYPNFNTDSFEGNIDKNKIIEESMFIDHHINDKYNNRNNIYNCSMMLMPNFGVEGSFLSSLRVSEDLLRSL